jgi:phage-related protein
MAKAKDSLIPLGVKMGEVAGAMVPGLIDAFVKLIEWTTPVLDGVIALADYFGAVVASGDPLNEFLGALPGPLQGVAEAFGNAINFVRENWPIVEQVVGTVVDAVAGFFRDTLGAGVEDAQGRFAFIKAWIDENMPLIRQTIENVLAGIAAFWAEHGETIMGVVRRAFDTISLVVDTVLKTVLGLIRAVLLMINGDWEGAWEEVAQVVDRAMDTIWTMLRNGLTSLVELVTNLVPDMWSAGGALLNALGEGISTGFVTLIQKTREKLAELRALLPFSEPKDPSSPLRGLARSGEAIVGQIQQGLNRASLNLGGVLGAPMAAGATYGPMTVNVYGATDAPATARAVDDALTLRRRRGGL